MIRTAVVDDDALFRAALRAHLNHYAQEHQLEIQITEYADGDELLESYRADYEIIFLDVMMDRIDGLRTAERIRVLDGEVLIIFVTNMPQFASRGYAVDALGYLMKPVSYPDLEQTLHRAFRRLSNQTHQYLTAATREGIRKLNTADLLYVEVQDHNLLFHMVSGTFSGKGTLSDIESRLDSKQFFRANKCYLINLHHVQGLQNCDVVVGSDTLQVSRARKKDLMDALNLMLNE